MLNSALNKKSDKILFTIILLLLFFGLVMISSAGIAVSKSRFSDEYFIFRHQFLMGVIPGFLALIIVQKIPYYFWKKIATPLFFIGILLLILVFIPGLGIGLKGASRWLNFGFFSFQPSEVMKLALIAYLAFWLEKQGGYIASWREGFIPFLIIMGLIGALIIAQPDMGTLMALLAIAFSMFFVAGAPWKFILSLVLGGVLLFGLLILIEPYRMDRIKAFKDHSADLLGSSYQVNQGLIAIGSGGFWGLGLGQSRQKFNYLPESIGDSIFAITCEELGFIGAIFLVLLFIFYGLRGFKIARNAPDKFSLLFGVGVSSWVVFQSFINIAANVKIIPFTGIPLPFISYGSTSLVILCVASGILLNISRYSKLI